MKKPFTTPILYIPFKRLNIVKQVFPRILEVNPQKLYIFQDGPRNEAESYALKEVIEYISNVTYEKNLKVFTKFNQDNLGPYKGVWEAVSWFFENEEQGIIIEEDIYPSLSFFYFCEKLLNHYKTNEKVWAIVGKDNVSLKDNKDIYFLKTFLPPWGFATWKDRWDKTDFNLKKLSRITLLNNSNNIYRKAMEGLVSLDIDNFGWDVRFDAFIKSYDGFVVHSSKNLVKHIGWKDGTHYSLAPEIDEKVYEIDIENLSMPEYIEYNEKVEYENLESWKYFDAFAGLFSKTLRENLKNILKKSGSVSIYGAGFLGRMLFFIYEDLFNNKLISFIDDNISGNIKDIPILKPYNMGIKPDIVIISTVKNGLYNILESKIHSIYPDIKIYNIKDLLSNLI